MQVKFLKDERVLDHLGQEIASFGVGEVVEMSTASARRWIRRNAAEEFVGEAKEVVRPTKAAEAESGPSRESGSDTPPSASQAGQASAKTTSSTSELPESKTDAESSSLTEPTSGQSGPTSATEPTRRGGGKRKTRRGSKAEKSA